MKKTLLAALLFFTISAGYAQPGAFKDRFTAIDRYIDSFMRDWSIPGMAMAVVYKDELIYAKGYGYRDLENKLPFTTSTIFPIASNTKLFTATAACMLEQEKKLSLDKPVRNYMPALHFFNDELNAKVTLRDMLAHRTGLPRYDGVWAGSTLSKNELISKVVFMKPQLGFREGYIYNNVMYAMAGLALETVTGSSWENIIRQSILQPLAMNATCFTNEEMINSGNFARSYYVSDSSGKMQPVTVFDQSAALGPAGIMKSNIEDISHWMIAQLNNGRYKGQQVIPEAAIMQTQIPNTISDREGKWPELSHSLYGLARNMLTYKGIKIVTHTGSIDGYYSNLTLLPAENLAFFLIHNSTKAGSTRSVMAFPVIDRLLNLSRTPWSERYMKEYLKFEADDKRTKDSVSSTQASNTTPSHALDSYTGKYTNPIYGDITIEAASDNLVFSFRKQRSVLHHFHYDLFITKEKSRIVPNYRLQFLTNSKGEIDRINVIGMGEPSAEFIQSTKRL